MKEALKPKTKGIRSATRAAKWIMAPLVAGILTIGCDTKIKYTKEIEHSGPSVDCMQKKECVHLLKKGDVLSRATDKETFALELKVADIDSSGVVLEESYERFGAYRAFRNFRVNFDGSLEGNDRQLELARSLNLKMERNPESDFVKVTIPEDAFGGSGPARKPLVHKTIKEKHKNDLGRINIH